jgi:exopolysaccharide biosynthesis polyprenyl glycosylphosphotransferase
MFRKRYQAYVSFLVAADFAAGLIALYLAYFFRYYLVRFSPLELSRFFQPELLPFQEYLYYFILLSPAWLLLLVITQRYSELIRLPLAQQGLRVGQFVIVIGFLVGFFSYALMLVISRTVFFLFLGTALVLLMLNRMVLNLMLTSGKQNEHNQVRILIVGTDERASRVAELLDSLECWGYQVVGFMRAGNGDTRLPDARILGSLSDLPNLLLDDLVVDEIIFVGQRNRYLDSYDETIKLCEELGIRTRVVADFFPTSASRLSLEFLDTLPLITFSTVPDQEFAILGKRMMDLATAASLLALFAPLMLLTAGFIKFTSRGPVFYRQVRCGLYGRRFSLMKFRTMIDGAEDRLWEIKHLNEMNGPVFKMRNDPRVTPLGRFLRKYSIDEIPQLWNVLKGEMSIVGPRAPLGEEVRYYSIRQRRRLSVKPGITCLWQVSGRSDIDFHRWMDMDLYYIDNWSLWLDFRILLKTIPAVFTGRGAR